MTARTVPSTRSGRRPGRHGLDLGSRRALESLLGRRVGGRLEPADRRAYEGATILVTGAGGTIGSALARRLAECRPRRLVLVERCEYALFKIERELLETRAAQSIEPVLADVTRARELEAAAIRCRPDVLFHAAAYKHVTMTERAVCAAVRCNVFGTLAAVRAARAAGSRFVLISSDKAAAARSVMGATKRLAELTVLMHRDPSLRPIVVRFGNVLASSGSVVEIMHERLCAGLPVQVTDLEATRYFMTAAEAVGLVLQADRLGRPGETYWLDLGEPLSIGELARRLIALGRRQGIRGVPIEVVGLRPGEKMNEELTPQGLELRRTAQPGVWCARQAPIDALRIRRILRELRRDVARQNALGALAGLRAGVPEFEPSRYALDMATAATVGAAASAPAAPSRKRA